MAAFPPREWDAFTAHWSEVLADDAVTKKTILFDETVVGYVVGFHRDGERLIGYWLGKEFWGQGIASVAVSQFLSYERIRPLFAHVVTHNVASIRVLEKCGFKVFGRDMAAAVTGGDTVEEIVLKLE